jgi:hypothetical protein
MKALVKVGRIGTAIVLTSLLSACANDPIKETTMDAKAINYGCSGTSINDCMKFQTPGSSSAKR